MPTFLFKKNLIKPVAYVSFSIPFRIIPAHNSIELTSLKRWPLIQKRMYHPQQKILSFKYPKALQTNLTLTKQIKKDYVLQNNIQGMPKQLDPLYKYFYLKQKQKYLLMAK